MSSFVLNRAKDILPKYMLMGNWKSKLIGKKAGVKAKQQSDPAFILPSLQ